MSESTFYECCGNFGTHTARCVRRAVRERADQGPPTLAARLSDLRLIELVADWDHRAWAGWTAYMLDRLTPENIARWRRQIATPYAELSPAEQESDRKEARSVLAVIVAALTPEPVRPSQDEIAWLIETMDPRFETRYYAGPVENNPLGHWCDNPSHGYRFKTQADAEAVVATFPVRRQSTYRCVEHLWMTPEPPPVVGRVFGGNKITSHDTRLFQPETPEPVCDCLPNVHYYAAPTDASCLCGNTMARASSLSPVRPTPEPVIGQNNELNRCAGCGGRGSEPLRDGLCDTCWPKYPALREPDIPSVRESDFMRAPEPVTPPITRRGRELCAACGGNGVFNTRTGVRTCERCHGDCYEATPEPVTPPPSAPSVAEAEPLKLARCKVCGTRWLLWPDLIPGGGWNLLDQYQRPGACCDNAPMGDQIEHLRDLPLTAAPASPSAPSAGSRADDGRGLAVDMIDVDRLREVSAHLAPHRRTWLRELADRLATQITETLSLRQSLREAEQERDALRTRINALIGELTADAEAIRDMDGEATLREFADRLAALMEAR